MIFTFWGQITNVVLAGMLFLVFAWFVPVVYSIFKTWQAKK
jgi:hypothetical protein